MAVDMSDAVTAVEDRAREIASAALSNALDDAKAACPVGQPSQDPRGSDHVPGTLRDSLEIEETVDASPIFGGSIGSDLIYASYTDTGTQDGPVIVPVNASVLRFWWENGPDGPDVYFMRRVYRRGSPGTQWFAAKNEDRWQRALANAV